MFIIHHRGSRINSGEARRVHGACVAIYVTLSSWFPRDLVANWRNLSPSEPKCSHHYNNYILHHLLYLWLVNTSRLLFTVTIKVAQYPVFLRLTNLETHAERLFTFLICLEIVSFGGHQSFTVRILGDFPHFLLALPSNNQFIIKLVKMWPGGTPHVVVGTLKISLDRL